MARNVFVSVGRCFRPEQEQFVASIETLLRDHDLEPRTIGRTVFSDVQPLQAVRQEMKRCRGAVIIAFERILVERGLEKGETAVGGVALTTPWNHIEAAIAYTLGLPMLVLKQRGVKAEGMLEKYDWYVEEFDPADALLEKAEFQGRFESWRRRVTRLF